jgi:hypothetical protein
MKNKIDIFILLLVLSVVACKNAPKSGVNGDVKKEAAGTGDPDNLGVAKTVTIPAVNNAVKPDTVVKSAFDNPVAVANNKYSHFDQILMRDLCKGLWKFDGGIVGGVPMDDKAMAGWWLQFYEDGRYQKGDYNQIKTRGKFTVDNLGFLEFTPSDNSEPKSEFQSKFNNDMLIMVGTQKYRDNKKQMKLSRIMTKPKK